MDNDDTKSDVTYWLREIDDAKERDKDYVKNGERVIGIYDCSNPDKVPFNILFSNTDTLFPALYSSVPRPVVMRRFRDEDPIGKAAAQAGTRMLEFLIDTNIDGYETFDDGMRKAVIDGLLPGRGVSMLKYDAQIEEDSKAGEAVCVDSKQWDQVLFGFARKWSKCPWLAFEESIDKDEAIRLFGADMAGKIKYLRDNEGVDDNDDSAEDEHQGERKSATIYQIWDKDGGRRVRYVCRQYKDGFLKVDDDPLELSGFFPLPKPMQFIAKANDFNFSAPYLVYENQAKELSEITRRITKLVKAIRAKYVYDTELGADVENLLSDDDENTAIPAEKSTLLSDNKGFDNAIWFMPIEQMVNVLTQLYAAREACKQVIYEVTGISDIIRGSTVASETATAQNIKSQWGTMRLKRNQAEVQRYARDMLRIMLEIAATKFSEASWSQMTGLPYATEQSLAQANQIMGMVQQFPDPAQIPQQYQTYIQQAQATLQAPKWSDVLGLLKNDLSRAYRIDIETNSTVVPEAVEDQKNMAEVMTALGQYLQGVTPLVESGSFPFGAAKAMMMATVRRFQFGAEIEDYINQMKEPTPPPPPPPPPDNTLQIKQMEIQFQQAESQAQAQAQQAESIAQLQAQQAETQKQFDIEIEKLGRQLQIEQGKAATEIHLKQMEIDKDIEIARINTESQMKQCAMNINASRSEECLEYDDSGAVQPSKALTYMAEVMQSTNLDVVSKIEDIIKKMEASLANLHADMAESAELQINMKTAPKQIIRDENGYPIGVSTPYGDQKIVRDTNNQIIGLQ